MRESTELFGASNLLTKRIETVGFDWHQAEHSVANRLDAAGISGTNANIDRDMPRDTAVRWRQGERRRISNLLQSGSAWYGSSAHFQLFQDLKRKVAI
ncbi:hypothetical protein CQ010_01020 [Arthrobacter sp. MYb211]|nr:hypothetical protein CIK76_13675 [Glutamicibacter sp. BW80]PRA02467.1 hypothetical protein CQ019_13475 [Arthrobacter sp. MYb229]PRA13256.1 hypothetical protein CQ015_03275 [Arthrobacter sp. MYb221]PRB50590.1 hypothetical protein CQ013_11350 [Arthrobacter sp. MYb216]PRC10452.1 hypothetical protein CQ010_01020 [Arthrobacter sp. MYb211]